MKAKPKSRARLDPQAIQQMKSGGGVRAAEAESVVGDSEPVEQVAETDR